ncbi:4'-phosphopantetheinyl transferase superfamily protein, partial [Mumia sp. zg.B17]|uniref:4'-phosphopantetheinyl transferase superfamily protein n=1 Tax=Mumia sp. zg.B17 TaxID=2855446 RepID=UPI001C6DF8DF
RPRPPPAGGGGGPPPPPPRPPPPPARWAAKEAVVKAWSASLHGSPPVVDESKALAAIEVVRDLWGRPRIVLHSPVREHLDAAALHVSLSHDGDYAIAYVVLTAA